MSVDLYADTPSLEGAETLSTSTDLDVSRVYREQAGFVWASLQRLGVRAPDLEDVLQEVFVVVHKRLGTFDGSSKITTFLFGICLRVASAYRRRGFRRNETCGADPPDQEAYLDSPEGDLAVRSRFLKPRMC